MPGFNNVDGVRDDGAGGGEEEEGQQKLEILTPSDTDYDQVSA